MGSERAQSVQPIGRDVQKRAEDVSRPVVRLVNHGVDSRTLEGHGGDRTPDAAPDDQCVLCGLLHAVHDLTRETRRLSSSCGVLLDLAAKRKCWDDALPWWRASPESVTRAGSRRRGAPLRAAGPGSALVFVGRAIVR